MRSRADQTLAIHGSEPVGNFFDRSFKTTARKILPGEFYATGDEAMIATVLGSCVSVCLYDPVRKVGGMNHFMLPGEELPATPSGSPRYGTHAMEQLLNRVVGLGADPKALEAKVVGAGRVIGGMQDIGKRNASFAVEYLQKRNITIAAVDVGDIYPRKVLFVPSTGRLFVKRLCDRLLMPADIDHSEK